MKWLLAFSIILVLTGCQTTPKPLPPGHVEIELLPHYTERTRA